MKIVHVAPPLARGGGPSGYLFELHRAARGRGWGEHDVVFPPLVPVAARHPPGAYDRLTSMLRRVRRHWFGAPAQYRPSERDLCTPAGIVHRNMLQAAEEAVVGAGASIGAALAGSGAEVLFVHDPLCAAYLLDHRRAHQRVWLMLHSPMPLALYLTWSWAHPEGDWRRLLDLPDVRRWVERELLVCERVDRVVLPCAEAVGELARVEARFARVLAAADFVLTGAAAPPSPGAAHDRTAVRRRWRLPAAQPVGLYLGNAQPYRGLDALLDALESLRQDAAPPGVVAVAGPPAESLPWHPHLRALGRVDDVAGLLAAVDFVINVNRFSLFDLSTIEALEAGRPLLLHATGGNQAFKALGAGCVMLRDLGPPTIAAGLRRMFTMAPDERRALGAASRSCYEAHLTGQHMLERHKRLYDEAAVMMKPLASA
jgi:glycosyltransferase involved in cell wall biosynthesis